MAVRMSAAVRRLAEGLSGEDREHVAAMLLALRSEGIAENRILAAFEATPRTLFVASGDRERAYDALPIAIECGQTLPPPAVQARIIQAAAIEPHHKVLEVGTGSGFAAAVMARLAERVTSVERYRTLAELAEERMASLRLGNVTIAQHDGLEGYARFAPYDRIVVQGAVGQLPLALAAQLKPDGVLVAPIGRAGAEQVLTRFVAREKHIEATPLGAIRMIALSPGRAAAL